MDLGAETAEEIALSILAELVQVRRGRADVRRRARARRRSPAARSSPSIDLQPVVDDIVLLDPVCGMTVDRAHARHLAEHDGVVYAFCSIGCRTRFIREPTAYVPALGILARLTGARAPRPPAAARRTCMHFEGSVPIKASREKVWAFVIDPNQVGQCGPGVEKIEVIDDTHFKATAKVGIGFISARFNVDMTFAELTPPDKAVIKAHGQAPGSAVDADAQMTLSDGPDGTTVMDWSADVNIAGTLASVGRAAHRGHGQQDDRPDLRLHADEARRRPTDRSAEARVARPARLAAWSA